MLMMVRPFYESGNHLRTSTDGRVTFKLFTTPGQENNVEMTYHLLNPSPPFRELAEEARSVVLAGGTMSPVGILLFT